jgi:hypothetical protein
MNPSLEANTYMNLSQQCDDMFQAQQYANMYQAQQCVNQAHQYATQVQQYANTNQAQQYANQAQQYDNTNQAQQYVNQDQALQEDNYEAPAPIQEDNYEAAAPLQEYNEEAPDPIQEDNYEAPNPWSDVDMNPSLATNKKKPNKAMLAGALIANVILLFLIIYCFTHTVVVTDEQKIALLKSYGYDSSTAVGAYATILADIEKEATEAYARGSSNGFSTRARQNAGSLARKNFYKELTGARLAVYKSDEASHPYTWAGYVLSAIFMIELIIVSCSMLSSGNSNSDIALFNILSMCAVS